MGRKKRKKERKKWNGGMSRVNWIIKVIEKCLVSASIEREMDRVRKRKREREFWEKERVKTRMIKRRKV